MHKPRPREAGLIETRQFLVLGLSSDVSLEIGDVSFLICSESTHFKGSALSR